MHRCVERAVVLALMMKITGFGGDGCLAGDVGKAAATN